MLSLLKNEFPRLYKAARMWVAIIIFICSGLPVMAQNCPPNIGFEDGNFTNWECSVGSAGFTTLTPSPPITNRHTIISRFDPPAFDQYGNFPTMCPYGGNYSVRLGNNIAGGQAEGLKYTFTIPSGQDTFMMIYYYAVVFQDPGHPPAEQPRFSARAYDLADNRNIDCASYDYVANGSLPGFEVSILNPSVLFKRWSPVSIRFTGLGGHTVCLEFRTDDCTRNGHFGYAYVDVNTICSNVPASAPYCIQSNALTLNAPYGFQNYTWYNHDYSQVLGTGQVLTLSPPPVVSGLFHVDMEPYPGYGCRDTADAISIPTPVPDTPVAASDIYYCQGAPATPLTATGLPGYDLFWYRIPAGGSPLPEPPTPSTAVLGNDDYYVSQKLLFGCESARKKITVHVIPPPSVAMSVNITDQCINNNQYTFYNNSTNQSSYLYDWDFGDGNTDIASSAQSVNHVYNNPGTYTAKLSLSNLSGCINQSTAVVRVHTRPVANMIVPPVICLTQTPINLQDNSTVPDGLTAVNSWWWNINGNISTAQHPAGFTISSMPTPVQLVVKSAMGCTSDTLNVDLNGFHIPVAKFTVEQLFCERDAVHFTDQSYIPAPVAGEAINQWNWQLGAGTTSILRNPVHTFAQGVQQVRLTVTSNQGCVSAPVDTTFMVHPKPRLNISLLDSCANAPATFHANDLSGNVSQWYWNFNNGFTPGGADVIKMYLSSTSGVAMLSGETSFGCRDTASRPFVIYDNKATAGVDTSAPLNEGLQLLAGVGNNMQYFWSPPDGLSNTGIRNPVATLDRNQTYSLLTISDKGCKNRSRVFVMRYKGPDIYVPSIFTPNNDAVNDRLRAVAYGIPQFDYLSIYDRYGKRVFFTRDIRVGWDGRFKNTDVSAGTYVYMARGIDIKGREVFRKGTIVLVR